MSIRLKTRLRAVRDEVERVCKMLESPTAGRLDQCGAALESAVGGLREIKRMASEVSPDPGALDEARQVQVALKRAGQLLKFAHDYHERWQRITGSMNCGYTAHGAPAAAPVTIRVWFQG
jgi:hypothetical protein